MAHSENDKSHKISTAVASNNQSGGITAHTVNIHQHERQPVAGDSSSSSMVFPEQKAKEGEARFRLEGTAIGIQEPLHHVFFSGDTRDININTGSAIWLRLMPVKAVNQSWSTQELRKAYLTNSNLNLSPLNYYQDVRFVRSEDGFGVSSNAMNDGHTMSLAYAFETGEVWSIDTFILAAQPDKIFGAGIDVQRF